MRRRLSSFSSAEQDLCIRAVNRVYTIYPRGPLGYLDMLRAAAAALALAYETFNARREPGFRDYLQQRVYFAVFDRARSLPAPPERDFEIDAFRGSTPC
jgi:hypothetical protein